MSTGLRTGLIVVGIAALVWALPSAGSGADAIGAALSAAILAALVLIGVRVYRETRGRLELLDDRYRLMLYSALGVLVVAMAARPSLVDTGPGTLLFLLLLAMPVAMLVAVWQHWRDA